METIAELSERVSKKGSSCEIENLYKLRYKEVARLGTFEEISINDISNLDRLGQFSVAQQFFGKCTAPAQQLLLNAYSHAAAAAKNALARLNNTAINA